MIMNPRVHLKEGYTKNKDPLIRKEFLFKKQILCALQYYNPSFFIKYLYLFALLQVVADKKKSLEYDPEFYRDEFLRILYECKYGPSLPKNRI